MPGENFILPVVSLVVAGILLVNQRRVVSELESGNANLRRQIAVARDAISAPEPSSLAFRANHPTEHKKPIHWETMVLGIGQVTGEPDTDHLRRKLSFERQLMEMDAAELESGLDRIAVMDTDDQTRNWVEHRILLHLAYRYPEIALNRFQGKIQSNPGMAMRISSALGRLAGKDVSAATTWLDREIAAGTFDAKSLDGTNWLYEEFESQIISRLSASDPAAVEARLSAMPAPSRNKIKRRLGTQSE